MSQIVFFESFRLHFPRTVVELSQGEFIRLLNQVMGTNFLLYTDNFNLPHFRGLFRFALVDISYIMKLVLGMYDQKFINYRYHFVKNETFRIAGTVTPDDYIVLTYCEKERVQYSCKPSKTRIIADRNDHKAIMNYSMIYWEMISKLNSN